MHAYDHVHLSEIRGGRVWNPLARGGIAPYRDHTVPQVRAINVRPAGSLLPFDSSTVCGTVSLVAAADDAAPMAVPGVFGGFPLSPALLTWSLAKVGGSTYVHNATGGGLPHDAAAVENTSGASMRAAATRTRRGSRTASTSCPGRFLYNLASFTRHALVPERALRDHRGRQRHAREQLGSRAAVQDREPHRRRDRLFASGSELGPVSPAVDPLQLLDAIDVRTRLRELDALAGAAPAVDVVLARVVGSQGVLLVAVLQQQVAEVPGAVADVDLGVVEILDP